MFRYPIEKKLRKLVEMATALGLRPQDRDNALNFLSHNEGGECFDTVVAQMHEYNIGIDYEFLKLAYEIQDDMGIDHREYAFLEELLKKGSYAAE